jgi:hypothetical protein
MAGMDENPYKAPTEPLGSIAKGSIIGGRAKFIRWFLFGALIIYPILLASIAAARIFLG